MLKLLFQFSISSKSERYKGTAKDVMRGLTPQLEQSVLRLVIADRKRGGSGDIQTSRKMRLSCSFLLLIMNFVITMSN